jgi:benzoyl-CoA-dihydrodiol lyase
MPGVPVVSFGTDPGRYRHLRLETDGEIAWIRLKVDEAGGLLPGYELKLNSYDLGVDIELADAVQRLRFEHPGVRAVVLTGGLDKVFCAGANIRMLAQSDHWWKVNFCKFTNETRNAIEDASEFSGQIYLGAVNGTAAGGGYELALACEEIILVDDGSTAVSLPEVPLLAVLPGTGGLTRLVDKRGVRKDLADVFSTRAEGVRGQTARAWHLVDEVAPPSRFAETVRERARAAAARSRRLPGGPPVSLTPLSPQVSDTAIAYEHVTAALDRTTDRVTITVHGPAGPPPADAVGMHAQGAAFWPLAMCRELDDLILWLRTNEVELGTWVLATSGDIGAVLSYEHLVDRLAGEDWLAGEIRHFLKRTLKRLDVTSRSLIALIEPGSCFAGPLLELALACDRQYMLDGLPEEGYGAGPGAAAGGPAQIMLTQGNFGTYPTASGLSRLASRFYGDPAHLAKLESETGRAIEAAQALELGLVTFAPDDLDWEDEVRIALEERASLSPDALTGMEANLRFPGPETMETKIFARLTAWQNWIFTRPNAAGPDGALRRYGTGQPAVFDRKRA